MCLLTVLFDPCCFEADVCIIFFPFFLFCLDRTQKTVYTRAKALKVNPALLGRLKPALTLVRNAGGAFLFGAALMGGIEVLAGGGDLPPPEDELQGYPPLSFAPDAAKVMGGK